MPMSSIGHLVALNQNAVSKHPVEGCVQAATMWLQVPLCKYADWESGPTPDVSFQGGLPHAHV